MKDEIKEILENVFDLATAECPSWDIEKIKKVEDYITNLQEENDYYFKKNNELSTLNTSLRSKRDNYKSRIEKAIECIENNICGGSISNARNLLNILKGDDKE